MATVHYKVINEAARTITAQASYNVSPPTVGAYFDKINCFCFTEQTMKPGETREMTVVFYVDPKIVEDRDQDPLNTITLSYTFYRLPEQPRSRWRTPTDEADWQSSERRRRWPRLIPIITTTTWSIRARGRRSAPPPPSSLAFGGICWMHHLFAAAPLVFGARRRSACSIPSSAGGAT